MSTNKKITIRRKRRVARVRSKIRASGYPRVTVFRSLNQIYAQIIDDAAQATLASCSSLELSSLKGTKKERAKAVGSELAKRILSKGISKVVFDRGAYRFHGRVQQIAEGLRDGGVTL